VTMPHDTEQAKFRGNNVLRQHGIGLASGEAMQFAQRS